MDGIIFVLCLCDYELATFVVLCLYLGGLLDFLYTSTQQQWFEPFLEEYFRFFGVRILILI